MMWRSSNQNVESKKAHKWVTELKEKKKILKCSYVWDEIVLSSFLIRSIRVASLVIGRSFQFGCCGSESLFIVLFTILDFVLLDFISPFTTAFVIIVTLLLLLLCCYIECARNPKCSVLCFVVIVAEIPAATVGNRHRRFAPLTQTNPPLTIFKLTKSPATSLLPSSSTFPSATTPLVLCVVVEFASPLMMLSSAKSLVSFCVYMYACMYVCMDVYSSYAFMSMCICVHSIYLFALCISQMLRYSNETLLKYLWLGRAKHIHKHKSTYVCACI